MNLESLHSILNARERRSQKQQELLKGGGTLISFTLNIPGPVKNARLYRIVHEEGSRKIEEALKKEGFTARKECFDSKAGACTFWLIPASGKYCPGIPPEAEKIKQKLMELEDKEPLGRLWDMDVLYQTEGMNEPEKISRTGLRQNSRRCLVCGRPVFICMRAGSHQVPEVLMEVIDRILSDENVRKRISSDGQQNSHENVFMEADPKLKSIAQEIAIEALRALLYEVCFTPKPGLVDADNRGAHRDMDIRLFFDSALSLIPYLAETFKLSAENRSVPPEKLLPLIRPLGIRAEAAMFQSTGGINTHKGAVFTMGLLSCAAGVLYQKAAATGEIEPVWDVGAVLETAGQIASSMENGSPGVRKEVMNGYPTLKAALPLFRHAENGVQLNAAGIRGLLFLMSKLDDVNIELRAGKQKLEEIKKRSAGILREAGDDDTKLLEAAAQFDREMVRWQVSPGGSADLLAAALFLTALENFSQKQNA